MEGLFGQAKSHHGLGRARLRGMVKMKIQALLTAMVINIKKLLQAVHRRTALAWRCIAFGFYKCLFVIKLERFQVGRWRFCLRGKYDYVLGQVLR